MKSKKSINVLVVEFDSMLQWNSQVAKTITKAKAAIHAIRLVRRYFKPDELRSLITSNYYSILFYNCEIWMIPS